MFAQRLQRAMVLKGWNQSELARRVEKFMPAGKKFGRDNVSKYINGRTTPGPERLDALARALDMSPSELLPVRNLMAAMEWNSPLDISDIGGGRMWLRVNQAVSQDVALKILALLKKDSAE